MATSLKVNIRLPEWALKTTACLDKQRELIIFTFQTPLCSAKSHGGKNTTETFPALVSFPRRSVPATYPAVGRYLPTLKPAVQNGFRLFQENKRNDRRRVNNHKPRVSVRSCKRLVLSFRLHLNAPESMRWER